jgi:hypothetical protein
VAMQAGVGVRTQSERQPAMVAGRSKDLSNHHVTLVVVASAEARATSLSAAAGPQHACKHCMHRRQQPMLPYPQQNTHTHTHACTHTHTHVRTHARTHTHTIISPPKQLTRTSASGSPARCPWRIYSNSPSPAAAARRCGPAPSSGPSRAPRRRWASQHQNPGPQQHQQGRKLRGLALIRVFCR